jgi:hypothetical protein
MERAMKPSIVACTWMTSAALALAALPDDASAALWKWGCNGPLGDQQIISTRDQLLLIPGKPPLKDKLRDLIFSDDLTTNGNIPKDDADIENYSADDWNSGLVKDMTFTRNDQSGRKLTLTEKSSKTLSHKIVLVHGCRDEITDRFRKVYRYQSADDPAHNITLECIDYLLTTRGGRSCG